MKSIRINAVILGAMLAICASMARAQATGDSAAPATVAVPLIPEDQQATKEQLGRLFEVMRVKQQMGSITRSVRGVMQQQFQQQFEQMKRENPQMASMTEEQQQAMDKVMGGFMEKAMNLYAVDEMIADVTEIYQKHMSRPDVEATIAFYSSPAGQRVLDIVPAIMQEYLPKVMQKTQDRMKPLILELSKQMVEVTAAGSEKSSPK